MPSVTLGRERFTLPIGETRVGGVGDDALPFSALRRLPTAAVLLVTANETVSLWPHGGEVGAVTVDGVPLGAEPVPVTHGAKIEVGGVRLIIREGRETGTTGPITMVTRAHSAPATTGGAGLVVQEGAWLARTGANSAVEIPESGLVIGRDPDSDLVVSGMDVSRRHAIVRRSARGYVLTDVSTNGTHVNGRRADGVVMLRAGDVVRIGEEEFRFEAGPARFDPAATPLPPRAQPSVEPPTAGRSRARKWPRLSKLWRR